MTIVALLQCPDSRHRGSYLQALRDLESITSVAIVDKSGGTFAEARELIQNKPVRTYATFDELRGEASPAMVIATFSGADAPTMIRPVLEAGVPVLAEKPACVNVDDFARLVEISERRRAPLMLALCNRLGPWAADTRRIVREGGIGRLYAARVMTLADQTRIWVARTRDWSFSKTDAGGGHLIWLGIHWLDLLLYLTGERVVEVQAMTGNVGGGPIDVEDMATVNLRLAGGALASLTSGYALLESTKQIDLSLWGSKGQVRFDANRRTLDWSSPEPSMNDSPNRHFTYDSAGGGYTAFVRECLRASLGEIDPPITSTEALEVLRVIFAAYESAERGQTVKL